MWLINTYTLGLEEPDPKTPTPPYTILSHTWGRGRGHLSRYEVQFCTEESWISKKIKLTCEQAIRDGISWACVDTCSIDKTSSAELITGIEKELIVYASTAKRRTF